MTWQMNTNRCVYFADSSFYLVFFTAAVHITGNHVRHRLHNDIID